MLPAFGNLFVEYLKLTSLLSVIGITELTFSGRLLMRTTGDPFAVWGLVLALYLAVALPLALLVGGLERRAAIGMRLGRG
jgi:polar amino acid transport system permease protein